MKRLLVAFGRFLYDFIIGDDWKIAVVVVVGLAATTGIMLVVHSAGLSMSPVTVIGGVVVLTLFLISMVIDLRPSR